MKKVLLGTTALVAAGFAVGQAQAADPIKLTLGGFYGAAAGVEIGGQDGPGEPSNDRQTGAFKNNVEVHFNGSTTLDNGLTVGAHIELEANNTANRTIDEVYTYFKGGFGEFRFGDTGGALGKSCIVDPGAITNNFGLISPNNAFSNVGRNAVMGLGSIGTCEGFGNQTKAVYFSPVFGGLQLALSYAPTTDNSNLGPGQPHAGGRSAGPYTGTPSNSVNVRNDISAYLTYNHTFGAISLTIGGGLEYGLETNNLPKPAQYQGGLQVGWGKFSVGASFDYYQNYLQQGFGNSTSNDHNDAWVATIGGSYTIDAWTIGLEGAHARFDQSFGNDQYWAASLQGTYKLGPGIRLEGEVAWFDYNQGPQGAGGPQATSGSVSIGLGSYITF
jgi:predicted porin